MRLFEDRRDAGQRLAERLLEVDDLRSEAVVVLALPRGGVPVGYEVAQRLGAPLDVMVVRKLGVPGHEELAMGAIASGGARVLNDDIVRTLRIPARWIDEVADRERREMERREREYRAGRPMVTVRDRTVVLVDDGLATGATMRAAARAVRQLGAARLVGAVPVGAPASCALLARELDIMVCLEQPPAFFGVGQWYGDFRQTSDDDVRQLLSSAWSRESHRGGGPDAHP